MISNMEEIKWNGLPGVGTARPGGDAYTILLSKFPLLCKLAAAVQLFDSVLGLCQFFSLLRFMYFV